MLGVGGGNILAFWRAWPPADNTQWEQEKRDLDHRHNSELNNKNQEMDRQFKQFRDELTAEKEKHRKELKELSDWYLKTLKEREDKFLADLKALQDQRNGLQNVG